MINRTKNEDNFNNIRNIYVLGSSNYDFEKDHDNENLENNNYFDKDIKMYKNNNNNIFLFEDFIWNSSEYYLFIKYFVILFFNINL